VLPNETKKEEFLKVFDVPVLSFLYFVESLFLYSIYRKFVNTFNGLQIPEQTELLRGDCYGEETNI
jgi:hypothetical protein